MKLDGSSLDIFTDSTQTPIRTFLDHLNNGRNIAITQFSDSYVISCLMTDKIALSRMLEMICQLNQRFYSFLGILMRGGLSHGQIIHEEDVLFGPAMNRAYEIESQKAKKPRVCIPYETFAHIQHLLGDDPNLSSIYKQDDFYVLDLASIHLLWTKFQQPTDHNSIPEFTQPAIDKQDSLITALQSTRDTEDQCKCLERHISIRSKYQYLLEQFKKLQG